MSVITSARPAGTAAWRAALIGTGLLGLASLGSTVQSGGNVPSWIAVADVVVGIAMLLLLIPAWRHSLRAAMAEVVLLVLVAVSAVPGVFVAGIPAVVRVIAGLNVLIAVVCAAVLVRASWTTRASAVTS